MAQIQGIFLWENLPSYSHYFSIHILLPSNLTIFFFLLHRLAHVESRAALNISYVHGPSSVPRLSLTVGQSLQTTVNKWPDREAVVFFQHGVRKSFSQFQYEVGSVNHFILLIGDAQFCHLV